MDDPLVTHIYTADPSANVFEGKVYIYPSHDRETDIKFNDNGDQYDMADYHVLSLDKIDQRPATDHGVVLKVEDVPWASKQVWAPDALQNPSNKRYHLYFPARDKEGIFRIGVATSDKPSGPFKPEATPIEGSYSIDPCSFVDDNDMAYLYFGGIWGGQLQCYSRTSSGELKYDASRNGPNEPSGEGVPALFPQVGKLAPPNLTSFEGSPQDMELLAPETGKPLMADDHERRFFEAPWMHIRKDPKSGQKVYYFSYSTGDTHNICYATGTSPMGPFTYRGKLLGEVSGWTTHHSICEFDGKWWLFYHDCSLSKGIDHLRSVKVREIKYTEEGDLSLAQPQ